ncbi:guanylate kinase [Cryobacterium sp. Sr8]|uniref:Guanylate kinase n=1 Tax=Cryobacterium psychrotolerans TaxID=386301 RepID=A0A1G8ZUA3_9MICO|nr:MULTISPECIES: guanylate kinase [Cryobacterium]TFD47401.1 guanylate kinase [Cryobacterium sp. TMT1-2-1]TFD78138.1 guanylate kinase [Cryobacterium sp. Sr8]TFD87440.1 guanylate kinase [Cryobacterium psychrotolerans]SDK18581.1 guanylate kinase [Cryobacterium psychrotolerans]
MAENRPIPPEVDRVAASRAAVAARRARAAVKSQVAAGERTALEVLAAAVKDPTGVEGRLRVTELLVSIPSIGVTKMRRLMDRLEISPSKRLGGLGTHQRERLRDFLSTKPTGRRGAADSRLVVLAGPTAVGKGTVAGYIREHYPEVLLSVSATTRKPRPGEVEGVSYYFVDDAEFDRMVEEGDLLEWAKVHNAYRYGTPRGPVDEAIAVGRSVLLEIDLQGARSVRRAMPEARLVFLLPPTWEELVRRLIGRDTEDSAEQARRLETAKLELAAQGEFDYSVVNTDVAEAAREVVDLMQTRRAQSVS